MLDDEILLEEDKVIDGGRIGLSRPTVPEADSVFEEDGGEEDNMRGGSGDPHMGDMVGVRTGAPRNGRFWYETATGPDADEEAADKIGEPSREEARDRAGELNAEG